jgi:hypothetical protein
MLSEVIKQAIRPVVGSWQETLRMVRRFENGGMVRVKPTEYDCLIYSCAVVDDTATKVIPVFKKRRFKQTIGKII